MAALGLAHWSLFSFYIYSHIRLVFLSPLVAVDAIIGLNGVDNVYSGCRISVFLLRTSIVPDTANWDSEFCQQFCGIREVSKASPSEGLSTGRPSLNTRIQRRVCPPVLKCHGSTAQARGEGNRQHSPRSSQSLLDKLTVLARGRPTSQKLPSRYPRPTHTKSTTIRNELDRLHRIHAP